MLPDIKIPKFFFYDTEIFFVMTLNFGLQIVKEN